MKHIYRYAALVLLTFTSATAFAQEEDPVSSQKFYICEGYDDEDYNLEKHGEMIFSADGKTLTIGKDVFNIDEIDSITFTKPKFPCIDIHWDGASATVTIDPSITGVTYTTSGGHVYVTCKNTTKELLYVLSGSSSNGSFTLTSGYKTRINLDGVSLTSSIGPAMNIDCGKRVEVKLMKNTVNTLTDFKAPSEDHHKATFNCEGHVEIKGHGTLNVTGLTKHAIRVEEYLKIKQSTGTINILGAVSDGIHCGDGVNTKVEQDADPEDNYFIMNGSDSTVINIANCGADCIDSNDFGSMFINGGIINMDVSQIDGNGLKCDSIIYMTGGKIVANVTGMVSNGIRSAYDMYLEGGTIECNISGNGSKGIRGRRLTAATSTVLRGGYLHFDGTNVKMTVSGGTYTVDNSNCQGIRSEYFLYQSAGDIDITVTNPDASAIYAKSDKWDGVSGTRHIH
ncbi:MAG: carbohydrate-binding domain-containing protein [Bacteroidales bacterium]|nr:carbohydrate-binding domain-containing protein [Bacteroidales bacterium]